MRRTYFFVLGLVGLATLAGALPDYPSLAKGQILRPTSDIAVKGKSKTNYLINRPLATVSPAGTFPPGLHPVDVQSAYKMPSNGGTDIIAIVDAFHNPTALADFNKFSAQFGLPTEPSSNPTASTNKVFQVVYSGGTQPAADPGWAGEIALDIEWAHALAPNAKIILVEAPDNGDSLYQAVDFAARIPGVRQVSMSFGSGGEFSGQTSYESFFNRPGIVYMASSGDDGGQRSYPAMSPKVVGVGGTALVVDSTGQVVSETAWSGAGGGPSAFFSRPNYQNAVSSIVGSFRGCPDIAAVADPRTGAAVYSSYAFGGWAVIGGTSLACPVAAGVANTRGFFKTSVFDENTRFYGKLGSANFRDITQGSAGSFTATAGWDYITGLGSPVGPYGAKMSFQPNAVTPYVGKNAVGVAADLLNADFVSYSIDGVKSAPYGTIGGFTTDVPFGSVDSKLVSDIKVSLTASSTNNNTTIQLHGWDYTKSAWVFVKSFQGSVAQRSWSTSMPNGDFVSGGKVRLLVRGLVPVSVPDQTMTLSVDQVAVEGFVQGG